MSIFDEYMRYHMLKVLTPSLNDVVRENNERMKSAPCFTQTIITINPKRHYPVRAHKRGAP